ncbi:MAG: AAA family ATPase, partial [Flavobacteriaceae bacterium]|nr:AAA family ATPase [Flavobacteriaceae bacterium]
MAKIKTTFYCQNCGNQYSKWQGQCTACREWNTIAEEILQKPEKSSWKTSTEKPTRTVALKISEIDSSNETRLNTQDEELNRVLGGGLVLGSVTLLGGEPGIGKSTLMLQVALNLPYKVLYVSGEESQRQIKMRANRLNLQNDSSFILTETNTQKIFSHISSIEPQVIVLDSIQTLHSDYLDSSPGS